MKQENKDDLQGTTEIWTYIDLNPKIVPINFYLFFKDPIVLWSPILCSKQW